VALKRSRACSKNTNYWDAANTQLPVVDFLPVTLSSTAINLYDTQEADVIWDKDLVPTEILDLLQKTSGLPFVHQLRHLLHALQYGAQAFQ